MKTPYQKRDDKPLVTIVTIVKNGKEVIRQTIDSVLIQSYDNLEYIVIDGGSSDGTVEILREYNSHLAYWISESDRGISDAFNKGIKKAHGEIIGLLNAGDWYEPDAVKYVVEAFASEKRVGVVCGKLQYWKGSRKEYLCESVPKLLDREMTVTHPTCFVRTDLYQRAGYFSEEYKYAMDYELLLRLKKSGASFLALGRIISNMQHCGISEENWEAALKETHQARKELLEKSFYTTILYLNYLRLKRLIRVTLERFGLESAIRFYRSRIALVRKTK